MCPLNISSLSLSPSDSCGVTNQTVLNPETGAAFFSMVQEAPAATGSSGSSTASDALNSLGKELLKQLDAYDCGMETSLAYHDFLKATYDHCVTQKAVADTSVKLRNELSQQEKENVLKCPSYEAHTKALVDNAKANKALQAAENEFYCSDEFQRTAAVNVPLADWLVGIADTIEERVNNGSPSL